MRLIRILLVAVALSLPAGQAWAAVTHGLWYARSAEFMHQPIIEGLVWLRVPGDVIFASGGVVLAWFALRLWRGTRGGAPVRARDTRPAPAE